jgi:hypothetical protein
VRTFLFILASFEVVLAVGFWALFAGQILLSWYISSLASIFRDRAVVA